MDNQTLVNVDEKAQVALRQYYIHLEQVRKYQKEHPQKVAEKNKKRYEKLKQDPEQYNKYLEYYRNYHKRTRIEKKELKMTKESPPTTIITPTI